MSTVVALVVAVLVVAWLTAAATAVRSVSRIWLRHWVESGGRGSEAALLYLEKPHRLVLAAGAAVALTVMLFGMYLGASPGEPPLRRALVVTGCALVLLVLGQLVPRAIARRWAMPLVPVLVPALRVVDLLLAPLVAVARRLGQSGSGAAPAANEEPRDSLEDLLREGEIEGVGEREAMAIISGVVQFGDKTARDVMTPRDQIFAVEASVPTLAMARLLAQAGYSRVPIYETNLDTMVGMVHVFDVIKATADRPVHRRAIAFTGANVHCNDLLSTMLRGRLHLAIVRDDAGHTVGLVTLEDLLEELVGDIRDEHDEHEEPAPNATREHA
jgi:putative hemolysin